MAAETTGTRLSRRARALALAAFRRTVARLDSRFPPGAADTLARDFDALQRDAFLSGGWPALMRVWLDEARSLIGLIRPLPRQPRSALTMGFIQDLREALRALARARGFSLIAMATLAAGIGVTSAGFAVFDAALLRPLPFRDADRLVQVAEWPSTGGGGNVTVAPSAFAEWRARATSFDQLEARITGTAVLTDAGDPVEVRVARVTPGYFALLGEDAVRGRVFGAADAEGGPCLAVISHALWQRRFAVNASIAGGSLSLDGAPCTIAGVLAGDSALDRAPVGVYTVLDLRAAIAAGWGRQLTAIGRLRNGVTLEQASGEMAAIAAAINPARGAAGDGWTTRIFPLRDRIVRGDARRLASIALAAVAVVLLVCCVNVAALFLSRAIARRHESAIRRALGASRWRTARHYLAEAAVLAAGGAIAGWVVGFWTLRLFVSLLPAGVIPPEVPLAMDWRVLAFTAAAAGGAALVCGLLPLLGSTPEASEIRAGGRSLTASRRTGALQHALLVVEIALATTVLAVAALLTVSYERLMAQPPGFEADRVFTARLAVSGPRYESGAAVAAFFERVLETARQAPGVAHAAAVTSLPLDGWLWGTRFVIDGEPQGAAPPAAHIQSATPGYFEAFRIAMRAGRPFRATDTARAAPIAIVNETLARRFVADGKAVGRLLRLGSADSTPLEIVGVAADVKTGGLGDAPLATPEIYVPHAQQPTPVMFLAVKTERDDAGAVLSHLRAAVRAADPLVPLGAVTPMTERVGASASLQRFRATMVALLGGIAGGLALVGVYSIRARQTHARMGEFGIRIALGATRASIIALSLGAGGRPIALGLALGLASAFGLARVIESWLFGIAGTEAWILAAPAAVLGLAGLAASAIPARRAAKADAAAVLRLG